MEFEFSYQSKDFKFVDELKKNLEALVCPICQELVNDPVLTSCGHLFCQKCLRSSSCPVCRQECTSMPDHFHARQINNLKVKCVNYKEGCKWIGELRDFEKHLKDACNCALLECSNGCKMTLKRKDIPSHILVCIKRNYKCPHCLICSRFDEITGQHLPKCPMVPVICPNKCNVTDIKRKSIESHMTICGKRKISCKYHSIGCEEKIPEDEMEKHLDTKKDHHLQLSMDMVVKLTLCLNEITHHDHLPTPLATPLLPPVKEWLVNHSSYPIPPWIIKMEGFYSAPLVWYSEPFLSHPGGYQMCLRVYKNGLQSGEGTHLSVFIRMIKGNEDEFLPWPFQGSVTFVLLNQAKNENHIKRSSAFTENTGQRIMTGIWGKNGVGSEKFIPLPKLLIPGEGTIYVADDSLFFMIKAVQL